MATGKSSHYYIPSERYYHSSHIIGDYMYMWGGDRPELPQVHKSHLKKELSSLLEVLNLKTGQWEQRRTSGDPPLGVKGYSSVSVGNYIMYFGGSCNHDDCRHNSMYRLNVGNFSWKELFGTNNQRGPMLKAYSNMVTVDFEGGEIYLLVICGLGPSSCSVPRQKEAEYSDKGLQGFVRTNEHHYFDIRTGEWVTPAVIGRCQPRYMSTLSSLNDTNAVLFGGNTPSGISNTVYIGYCTRTAVVWQKLVPNYLSSSCIWPCGRYGHTATVINNCKLLVLGGAVTNDCWTLDIAKRIWKEESLQVPSTATNRYDHSMSVWSVSLDAQWIIVFGGLKNSVIISQPMIIEMNRLNDEWLVGGSFELPHNSSIYLSRLSLRRKIERSLSLPITSAKHDFKYHEPVDTLLEQDKGKEREEERGEALQLAYSELEESHKSLQEELSRCQQEKNIISTKLEHEVKEKDRLREEVIGKEELQIKVNEYQTQLRRLHLEILTREERERELQETVREMTKQINDKEETKENHKTIEANWLIDRDEIQMTEEVVGRGGWGQVKVAIFRGLRVAAKCLHEIILSEYNISVFRHEMEMAAKIRHPNLLQFIGATQEDPPLILTELMPTSLRKELETRTPLTHYAVLNISLDVACALNYLHLFKPHPILHRDVSSANVLLQPAGENWKAKLSDYGSSNLQNLITHTISPGNPLYSAPEAINPLHHSPAMDVYSYGVLVLEISAKKCPQVSEREIHLQMISDEFLRQLIRSCLNEHQSLRPNMVNIIKSIEEKLEYSFI